MKLTVNALAAINDPRIRMLLALALGVGDPTIIRYINKNRDNGPLTTVAALEVIQQETGLGESQILERVEEKAAA